MTFVKTLVASLVVWALTYAAPYLSAWGFSPEMLDSLSTGLQVILVAVIAGIGALIGKRTGLIEPAGLIVAAIEVEMTDANNAVKKAEATKRLLEYIDKTVTNPFVRIFLQWGAGAVIEHVLPLSKQLLKTTPPIVEKPNV